MSRLSAEPDQHLMLLVAEGHERAYEVLVGRYRPELLRYCSRLGLVDQRAEDVLQQALLQAWLALQGEREVRELRPWLYRVVHNAAVNAMRRQAREERTPVEGELVSSEMVEPDLGRGMAVRAALSEVAALPEMQREAILLSAVEGRSHDEVASVLGVSSGAVRGLLYRARATLRSAAAAVLPAPLIGWAHGWLARASSAVERLPGTGDGPTVLFKGAAVAATAALVAGAAVTPLHGHITPRSGRRTAVPSHQLRAAPPRPSSASSPVDAHAGARLIAATAAVKRGGSRGTAVLVHLQGASGSGKVAPQARRAPPAGRVSAPASGDGAIVASGPPASSSIPSQSAQVASQLAPSGGGDSTTGEAPKGTSGSGGSDSGESGSKGDDSGSGESSGSADSHTESGDDSEGHGSDHPEGSEESDPQREPSEVTGEGKRDN